MKKLFARMNAKMNTKGLVTSLVFALSVTACSSRQAVVGDSEGNESQAEEEMILGEGTDADGSDLLSEEASSVDSKSSEMPDAEIVQSDSPSLPSNPNNWHGSLKSQYEAGMTEWKVSRGESLSLIAGAVFGNTGDWKKLAELNPELSDPNVIVAGQILRLPGSSAVAKVEQVNKVEDAAAVAPQVPIVSNVDAPAQQASSSEAAGGMGVVDTNPPPSAPVESEAPVAAAGDMNSMVQRVDLGGNKLKLRNILLGVAGFFLLLAGLIFVLSRRKAAKVG